MRARGPRMPDVVAVLPVDVALEAEAETALIVPQVSETVEGEKKKKRKGGKKLTGIDAMKEMKK